MLTHRLQVPISEMNKQKEKCDPWFAMCSSHWLPDMVYTIQYQTRLEKMQNIIGIWSQCCQKKQLWTELKSHKICHMYWSVKITLRCNYINSLVPSCETNPILFAKTVNPLPSMSVFSSLSIYCYCTTWKTIVFYSTVLLDLLMIMQPSFTCSYHGAVVRGSNWQS